MWGRQSYRFSDFDFNANLEDGHGVDWPVRYKEIAPWYDYVEKFAGISGNRDGLAQLPDGQFMPAMEMTCVEKDVAPVLKNNTRVPAI
jgi:choline dehydrogenase-like flavoprotein